MKFECRELVDLIDRIGMRLKHQATWKAWYNHVALYCHCILTNLAQGSDYMKLSSTCHGSFK